MNASVSASFEFPDLTCWMKTIIQDCLLGTEIVSKNDSDP